MRLKCQCALCIDELSGRKVLNDQKVPSDVHPTQMIQKGNYAVAIIWSDGHAASAQHIRLKPSTATHDSGYEG